MLLDVLLTFAEGIDLVLRSSSSLLGGKFNVGLSIESEELAKTDTPEGLIQQTLCSFH
jgi:hypothetical protein